jgi:hypothetical protein
MGMVHVLIENSRGFFAPFFGRFKNNQALWSGQRILVTLKLSGEGIDRQPEK